MPVLIEYFLKLSVGLAIICIFYYALLRRLTFYNWNRWYLLGYTFLVCVLPFLNIEPILERNNLSDIQLIESVPVISKQVIVKPVSDVVVPEDNSFNPWQFVMIVIQVGMLLFVARFIIRLMSFLRIRRKAVVMNVNGMNVFQLDMPVKPFSFGNSIFLNKDSHTSEELKEIIRHEFIHIRQKHTVDILWAELLVIVNWFNPFAWILRNAMRQNLEFIADNKVIETGVDRKSYQYLLLKVIGSRSFSVANNFNYSSLKTRIAMMNKIKSARIHVLRFLFILPLLAVLLLSFRNRPDHNGKVNFGGIAIDVDNKMPVPAANVTEVNSGLSTKTDENGYFHFSFPGKQEMELKFKIQKEGFINQVAAVSFSRNSTATRSLIEIIGMKKGPADADCKGCFNSVSLDHVDQPAIFYENAKQTLQSYLKSAIETTTNVTEADPSTGNLKGIVIVSEDSIVLDQKDKICAFGKTTVEISDDAQGLLIYENKSYSPSEFKAAFSPGHSFDGATIYKAQQAMERFGTKGKNGVIEFGTPECAPAPVKIIKKDTIPFSRRGTALHFEDKMDESASRFFKRNHAVQMLYWKPRSNNIEVYLKNGEVELYEMPDKMRSFEMKYGQLPDRQGSHSKDISSHFNEKGFFLDIIDNNGECTVSVIDQTYKELTRVALNDWSENEIKKYGRVVM